MLYLRNCIYICFVCVCDYMCMCVCFILFIYWASVALVLEIRRMEVKATFSAFVRQLVIHLFQKKEEAEEPENQKGQN